MVRLGFLLNLIASQWDVVLLPAESARLLATFLVEANKDLVLFRRGIHEDSKVAKRALLQLATCCFCLPQSLNVGLSHTLVEFIQQLLWQCFSQLCWRNAILTSIHTRTHHLQELALSKLAFYQPLHAAMAEKVAAVSTLNHLVRQDFVKAALTLNHAAIQLALNAQCLTLFSAVFFALSLCKPDAHKLHFGLELPVLDALDRRVVAGPIAPEQLQLLGQLIAKSH
mmetsp:Transcript_47068/g.112052  ORF Transcript_47068/g.112052 Transcript_47068/m.112052 type:complete len:226 (-) Transcript_47068:1403-2080(-)